MELENNENQVPNFSNYHQQSSLSLEIKPLSENNRQFISNTNFKFPLFQQSVDQQPLLFLNQQLPQNPSLFISNSMGLQAQNDLFYQAPLFNHAPVFSQAPVYQALNSQFLNKLPQIQSIPQNADEDVNDGDYNPEEGNVSDSDEEEYIAENEMVEGIFGLINVL